MQMIETSIEQRGLLPLPSAALVIDIRGVSDDEVVEWLSIELADMASDMKTYNVHHWRFLTDFLSFIRIMPATSNSELVGLDEDENEAEQLGLIGHVHTPQSGSLLFSEENTNTPETGDMPSHLLEQRLDELIHEIDRLRNNRIAAVTDLNKAGIPGRSSKDATVRVIFLTDASRPDSLSSAALYADHLKTYYRKYERSGHQALINTTVLCLGNTGEAGPPNTLIQGLMRNNSWDHLDTLILSENYREDAALIAGTTQAYLAELLLYVLLIVPPFSVGSSVSNSTASGQQTQDTQQGRLVSLPSQTYVVGLAALEYSARWGRRWLNFGLAKEVADILRQKPSDGNKEKVRIADTAASWFRDWHSRIQETIPASVPGDIEALQGIHRARQITVSPQNVFTLTNLNANIGKSSIRDLQDYLHQLAQTYVSVGSEPALQDALMQSTPQIMQALQGQENKSLAERKVAALGALQVEAEQFLGHPKLFTSATGSVPRARTQLWALGATISRFQQEHQKNPLNPLSMKDTLQNRQEELEKTGNKMINNLQKHLESWPLFSGLLPLKGTLVILTLIVILFLSMVTTLLGFAWLHHLIVLKAPNLLSFVDATLLGIPILELVSWAFVLGIFIVELITFIPHLILDKRRSALQVELIFLISLFVFALYGFFVNFSIVSLRESANDPTSIQYLAWLAPIPAWSLVVFGLLIALLIGEVLYFFWWLNHLYKERKHIAEALRSQHEQDIQDVINFIAADVSLEILQRAELTDGDGGLGGYYFRISRLCDLLDEVADKSLRQQQMATHRLLLSQSETQQGAEIPSRGGAWLNLRIRDEMLETDALTDGYKGLKRKLVAEHGELRELAEFLLRVEGVEKPIEIGQQFEERPSKGSDDERRLQILITALVSMMLRFAVDPLSVRNIAAITEEYKSTSEYTRQHMPALNALIQTLNKKLSQATLQSLMAGGASNSAAGIDSAYSSISTDAVATWGQLFWQTKAQKLEPVLMQDGVLTQLIRLAGQDYDPRAVMRRLLAHTALFGRSLKTSGGTDLYLLIAPSSQSHQFRQGLKSMKLPRILDFPDTERILLLGVKQYIAPSMLLPIPKHTLEQKEVYVQEPLPPVDQVPLNGTSTLVPPAQESKDEDVVPAQSTASPSSSSMGSTAQTNGNGSNATDGKQGQDDIR